MALWIMLLLSLLAGAASLLAGAALGKALLLCLGFFLGLNLLYIIFWVIVAQTVDDTKPIEKQKPIYRFGCASIAGWLCAWGGVDVRLSGTEKLPKEGRFLYICNHRAAFDPIVAANVLRDWNISYISKPSNLKIPFIGKLAYGAGFLPINRENDREALKTILLAADYMKKDFCSIGIYPEGTRSKTGELLPFHAGSFKVAQKANVPIAVAVTRGTELVGKNFPLRRTKASLEILELIPTEQVKAMSTQALAAHCRETMETALGATAKEASA